MEDGWIKLHRKIKESIVWSNEKALKIWLNCLLRANHKCVDIFLGRKKVQLRAGQFITSYPKFGDEVGYAQSTVFYWFGVFEVERMIERSSKESFTLVTITNWNDYQRVERKVERVKKGQRKVKETDKKDKKEENDKNIYIQAKKLLETYNRIYEKELTSTKGFESNLAYWLEDYSLKDIEAALEGGRRDDYWREILTPVILLRRKNRQGEDVDYIGDLKNRRQQGEYRTPDGKSFDSYSKWKDYCAEKGWAVTKE